jgi:NAD(P)-dependent dehydrogenase (short-subunit alcohol dehydrogenase family)|tara:strand:- start:4681 stop:5463 length:783 start_codon:yes stop_codon:yes gene_type:complete
MRNLDKQDDLLEEAKRRDTQVKLMQLDVTDDESIQAVVGQIESEEGRLDVLINNAGYGIAGFFEDLSEKEIRDQMETNFFGVQKVTRHALPLMRKTAADRGGVKIINISSVQGRSPIPALGAYATSKWALEGFSEGLYHELRPFDIHVVSVEPGAYRTKILAENGRMAEAARDEDSPYAPFTSVFQKRIRRQLEKETPGLGGDAEVVARLIEKIVDTSHPRFRYLIGGQARLSVLLRSLLPFSLFSRLISRVMFGKVEVR